MPQSNVYCIYGMNVQSPITLPALKTYEQVDVTITQEELPNVLSEEFAPDKKIQFDGNRALINQPLFGKILLEKQGRITLDFHRQLSEAHTITALQGSGLGIMLHLRGNIPLHGMALETSQGAILVLADSGLGKSTLATSLLQAKVTIFSDDIIALHQDEHGRLNIHPAHRRVKLTTTQLISMGIDITALSTTAPGINKFGWDIPTTQFAQHPMPVVKCIFLQAERLTGIKAQISPISRFESFRLLRNKVYRPPLIRILEQEQCFFKLNQTLQDQCQSYTMQLPDISNFASSKEYGESIANQLLSL